MTVPELSVATKNEALSERALRDRALFDTIAYEYCRKDLLSAHRAARKLRTEQTVRYIPGRNLGSVLEVGCGAGFSAAYLAGAYSKFVGIDYSEKLIDYAREKNNLPGAEFVVGDVNAFAPDELFDVVLMVGFLHHVDDATATLRHLKSFVRPGGWIAANEPQKGNRVISAMRGVRKKVDRKYSDEQLEFSKQEMFAMFGGAGLCDVSVRPHGLFSTPFAEVAMPFQWALTPIVQLACATDRFMESQIPRALEPLSFNLVAVGRRFE